MDRFERKLADYLKLKRVKSTFTQFDVAKKIGYTSPQFISNIERGLCFPPNKVLKEMVKLYKIKPTEIMRLLVEIDTQRWKKVLTKKAS